MNMKRKHILSLLIVLSLTGMAFGRDQLQTDEQREQALRAELEHLHIADLSIDVRGGMVRLTGTVDSLFLKKNASKIARKEPGVENVYNDLDVVAVKDAPALRASILEDLGKDRHYTMYDFLEVSVDAGAITLEGRLAPGGNEAAIEETVSKVRGVRSIENDIRLLPYSASDERLREAIALGVADALGEKRLARTDLHIVVENGDVTLAGVVRDDRERKLIETCVRNTKGTSSVTNLLEVRMTESAR